MTCKFDPLGRGELFVFLSYQKLAEIHDLHNFPCSIIFVCFVSAMRFLIPYSSVHFVFFSYVYSLWQHFNISLRRRSWPLKSKGLFFLMLKLTLCSRNKLQIILTVCCSEGNRSSFSKHVLFGPLTELRAMPFRI